MGRALPRQLQSDSGGGFQLSSVWETPREEQLFGHGDQEKTFTCVCFCFPNFSSGKTFLACSPVEGRGALKRGSRIF